MAEIGAIEAEKAPRCQLRREDSLEGTPCASMAAEWDRDEAVGRGRSRPRRCLQIRTAREAQFLNAAPDLRRVMASRSAARAPGVGSSCILCGIGI
jgi:hypothetical protein